ncbi:MAG TPA: hypothetical protein VFM17_07975 [Candidatus Eisenbacteria bacterium]|nr:hypothetical protein [Candidatus Eisenbacteria bacterium]
MRHRARCARRRAGIAALAVLTLAGIAGAQELVPTGDPAHPRVRYSDSLISLNDRCAVRQGGLNPTYAPVYVNGRPIGFC